MKVAYHDVHRSKSRIRLCACGQGSGGCRQARRIPYAVPGVELGHHDEECSFEAMLKKFRLTKDPALVLLGKIVNGAETDNSLWHRPESAGLRAIAEGFRSMGYENDHEQIEMEWVVYDALYAYCRQMTGCGNRRRKSAFVLSD